MFTVLSVKSAYAGGYGVILSFFALLISALILKGVRLGYLVGKLLLAAVAVSLLGELTPFAYQDALRAKIPYAYVVCGVVLAEALLIFLFYSLREHAKLRHLNVADSGEKERVSPHY